MTPYSFGKPSRDTGMPFGFWCYGTSAVCSASLACCNRMLETHVAQAEQGDGHEYTVLWRKDLAAPQASFVVGSGQVFVLGDNRDSSLDSRRFGTVPIADVKGTAKQVLFSHSPSEGMRWRRIGQWLD